MGFVFTGHTLDNETVDNNKLYLEVFSKLSGYICLMIDGDKKVVSKQPFASFPKVNSLQS